MTWEQKGEHRRARMQLHTGKIEKSMESAGPHFKATHICTHAGFQEVLKARKMWKWNYCGFPPWLDEISRLFHSLNTIQRLYLKLLHILGEEEGKI